jgi:hypothetical protein
LAQRFFSVAERNSRLAATSIPIIRPIASSRIFKDKSEYEKMLDTSSMYINQDAAATPAVVVAVAASSKGVPSKKPTAPAKGVAQAAAKSAPKAKQDL